MTPKYYTDIRQMDVQTSHGIVPMPILYHDTEMVTVIYSASLNKLRALLPGNNAVPPQLLPGKSVIMFSYCCHHKTSIGPYLELSIGIPILYKPTSNIPLISAMSMFGTQQISHTWYLVVSTPIALSAGNELMACNKVIGDMKFKSTEKEIGASISENGQHLVTLTVKRIPVNKKVPYCLQMVNYSGPRDNYYVCMPYNVYPEAFGMSLSTKIACLSLGEHPVAGQIRQLGLSRGPIATLYTPSMKMVLPFPEIRLPV